MASLTHRSMLVALAAACAMTFTPHYARAQDQPPAGGAPSKPALDEARTRYERGTQLYADGEYKLALIEFQRAYELAPSYRLLFNIGQVNLQLGNYAAALKAFEKYLAEGGTQIPAKRRAEVEKELPGLRGRTAHLAINVSIEGADITIDGAVVGTSPLSEPLLVNAGQHTVAAKKAGRIPASKDVTLAGADEVKIDFELPEQPSPVAVPQGSVVHEREVIVAPADKTSYVWVGWLATGALAAGAIGTGIAALEADKDLKDTVAAPPPPGATAQDQRDSLDSKQSKTRVLAITTDALIGAGVIVGAVTMYFTIKGSGEKKTGSVPLRVGVGPRAVALTGGF